MRCPYPDGHPIHDHTGNATVAAGQMTVTIAASGAATLVLPDGRRMAGVLYAR